MSARRAGCAPDTLDFAHPAGANYPALHRLEQNRWLTSEWRQSETDREATFYALTRASRKRLAVEKADWNRLAAAVRLIFDEA